MSTTIDVLPTSVAFPTFGDVVALATNHLHAYLSDLEIAARPVLQAEIHTPPNARVRPTLTQPLRWERGQYGWFFFDDIGGGTDAHFVRNDDLDREVWEESMAQPTPQMALHLDAMRAHLAAGHRWYLRRSVGQSAAINLTYGLLAAAVAELTDGLLSSEDGAWDGECFPCRPDDFLRFYLRPEHARCAADRDWSRRQQVLLRERWGR